MENKKIVITIKIEIEADNFLSKNFEDAFNGLKEIGKVTLEDINKQEE